MALSWMLTPTAESAIQPLRAKLASKMTVLGVLAGFTLAVTAGVLDQSPTKVVPRALAGGAVTCFACAAAIYVCVLLTLTTDDAAQVLARLLFASKWHARGVNRKVVRRPPSSAGIVIYQHMISLWHSVIWALGVSWVGIVLLALSEVWVNSASNVSLHGGVHGRRLGRRNRDLESCRARQRRENERRACAAVQSNRLAAPAPPTRDE